MVLHEHGRGLRIFLQGFHHAFADSFGADETERTNRHRTAEFVTHHGQTARNVLTGGRPCGGVGGVGVHYTVDVGHVAVDVGVGGGVGARGFGTVHHVAVEVANDHRARGEVLVTQAGGLDDHQVGGVQTLGDVAGGPHHEVPLDELLVQGGHDFAHLLDFGAYFRAVISQSCHDMFPFYKTYLVSKGIFAIAVCSIASPLRKRSKNSSNPATSLSSGFSVVDAASANTRASRNSSSG